MLARQRDQVILDRLRQTGTESARELAQLLKVSAATVRRDLERLERDGALERVYGGAFLPGGASRAGRVDPGPGDGVESPFGDVVDRDAEHKERVARAAAAAVRDGQVVLLDIGTTTLRVARALRGRPVTVVTSSLAVLDALRDDPAVELVLVGGQVRRNFQSLVGPLALDALASMRADVAVLSCTGVHPDGTVVDDMSVEASLKRALVTAAREVVLVAPAAKFPGTGSLRICSLADVDLLVTTDSADERALDVCRHGGGRVVVA